MNPSSLILVESWVTRTMLDTIGKGSAMVTVDDVRSVLADLPRSYEVVVRGRMKFRVGQIVYVAFSRDEAEIGFGFPREEREYLVASDPETFMMPGQSDLRFQWAEARMAKLEFDEMRDLVIYAWSMCVPRYVWEPYVVSEP